LLVGLLLFQAASGLWLSQRYMRERMDRFRAFQFASGFYLAFYVVGHMDSVFIFARAYLEIDMGWAFATGAPQGLIRDPWNVRLVPHYWLGVFFVLSHLSSGLRGVLLAHGWRRAVADRIMIGGSLTGSLVATLILLGMCGMRIQFI
jgi:succinate dehydrogenase hydrophobic anchor subunit